MNLVEFIAELERRPEILISLFGITPEEFQQLRAAFNATSDRSSRLPEAQKFVAILLIRRFNLDVSAIRKLVYQTNDASVSTNIIATFKKNAGARLDAALKRHPAIAAHLNAAVMPLQGSARRPLDFPSLDKLAQSMHDANQMTAIVTHKARDISDEWISNYLHKRVTAKKKTGQRAFEQVMNCLTDDIESGVPKDEYLAWQMATAFNFHAHNSSYAPQTGFGSVQRRESEHPLFYARSQGKHTHGLLFKTLTATNRAAQCLMPKNESLYRVLRTEFNKKFIQSLNHYDARGYKKAGTPAHVANKLKYYALQFAYTGLRKSNYDITVTGVRFALNTQSALQVIDKASEELFLGAKQPTPILKVTRAILLRRMQRYHQLVDILHHQTSRLEYYPDLYRHLTKYRRANARLIQAFARNAQLNFLKLAYDRNTNTLDIRFYPNKTIPDSANYTLGITNILINYFIGLLNAKLQAAGIEVQAERRQSFAFNRITITDTVSMTMRVSLGYEPAAFVEIFNECLRTFNDTLRDCDFSNPANPVLARGFEVVERPRKEGKVTAKTGIRFFNVMRSNDGQLKSTVMAKNAVAKHADQQRALQSYLKRVTSDQFKQTEYKNQLVAVRENRDTPSAHDNILVIGLLNNVMKYTFDFLGENQDIAEATQLAYSYAHHVGKLVKQGYKGLAWLEKHREHPASHVYAKTLLLVESMLEHLTSLHSLRLQHDKPDINSKTHVRTLENVESTYVKTCLETNDATVQVYFTDNGQQALTTGLVSMAMQTQVAPKLYAYGKCYYEFFNNLKENLEIALEQKPERANIICVDIREIAQFKNDIPNLARARAVIIDCTHNPCLRDNQVNEAVTALLEMNCQVLLVGSMLKHEQLGMDKFQNGKIAVISPAGHGLLRNVHDELRQISNESMHPVAAAYYTMMNTICQDKLPREANKNVPAGLRPRM